MVDQVGLEPTTAYTASGLQPQRFPIRFRSKIRGGEAVTEGKPPDGFGFLGISPAWTTLP